MERSLGNSEHSNELTPPPHTHTHSAFRFYSDKSPFPREGERVAGEVRFGITAKPRVPAAPGPRLQALSEVQWGLRSCIKRGLADGLIGTPRET